MRILLQPGSANGPQSYIHTNLALHRRRWMLSQRNFPLLAGLHTPCLLLTSSASLHRLPLNCARPYLPIRHTWGCFNPPPLYPLVACAAQMSLPETYAHFPSIVTPPGAVGSCSRIRRCHINPPHPTVSHSVAPHLTLSPGGTLPPAISNHLINLPSPNGTSPWSSLLLYGIYLSGSVVLAVPVLVSPVINRYCAVVGVNTSTDVFPLSFVVIRNGDVHLSIVLVGQIKAGP